MHGWNPDVLLLAVLWQVLCLDACQSLGQQHAHDGWPCFCALVSTAACLKRGVRRRCFEALYAQPLHGVVATALLLRHLDSLPQNMWCASTGRCCILGLDEYFAHKAASVR